MNYVIGGIVAVMFLALAALKGVDFSHFFSFITKGFAALLHLLAGAIIWITFEVSIIIGSLAKAMYYGYVRYIQEYRYAKVAVKTFREQTEQDHLAQFE